MSYSSKHLSLLLLLATVPGFPWATEDEAGFTFGSRSSHEPGCPVRAPSLGAGLGMGIGHWLMGLLGLLGDGLLLSTNFAAGKTIHVRVWLGAATGEGKG